jgi:hypothetical protein
MLRSGPTTGERRIIGAACATETCRALDGVSGSFDPREFLTQGRIHTTDIVQRGSRVLSHQERLISELDLRRQLNAWSTGRQMSAGSRRCRAVWHVRERGARIQQAIGSPSPAFDHRRYRRPASMMYAAMSTQNA